jgi:hypothetical protein
MVAEVTTCTAIIPKAGKTNCEIPRPSKGLSETTKSSTIENPKPMQIEEKNIFLMTAFELAVSSKPDFKSEQLLYIKINLNISSMRTTAKRSGVTWTKKTDSISWVFPMTDTNNNSKKSALSAAIMPKKNNRKIFIVISD